MTRIFLDANVLLELLFRRARYDKLIASLAPKNDVRYCVSVLSLDIVMYFVELEKQSKHTAWEFLSRYEILDITAHDALWANENDGGDFEDALQIACARRQKCSRVVTLDKKMERMYGTHIAIQTVR